MALLPTSTGTKFSKEHKHKEQPWKSQSHLATLILKDGIQKKYINHKTKLTKNNSD